MRCSAWFSYPPSVICRLNQRLHESHQPGTINKRRLLFEHIRERRQRDSIERLVGNNVENKEDEEQEEKMRMSEVYLI